MSRGLELVLSKDQRDELEDWRDHHGKAYVRERAAAVLKVADGQSIRAVARAGLLRKRHAETVCQWLQRYRSEGVSGLLIREGRGRKPSFSPPSSQRRRRARRVAAVGPA